MEISVSGTKIKFHFLDYHRAMMTNGIFKFALENKSQICVENDEEDAADKHLID
jgi:hypothetical protein